MTNLKKNTQNMQLNTLEHIKEFKIIKEVTSLEVVIKQGEICPTYTPKRTK